MKGYFIIFITVFLAELGDKTQLATLLFATKGEASKLSIFVFASLALICTTAIGVFVGGLLGDYLNPKLIKMVAGFSFIAIGIFTIFSK